VAFDELRREEGMAFFGRRVEVAARGRPHAVLGGDALRLGLSLYIGIIYPWSLPKTTTVMPVAMLPDVIFYDKDQYYYGLWDRKEAIKFSLEQVDSSIRYLFVGAAAILGYVLKILLEPRLEPDKAGEAKPITGAFTKLLLLHAAFGSIISIACGFFARLFLTTPGDSLSFSIYKEAGLGAFGQLMAFFFAAIVMICAAISLIVSKTNTGGTSCAKQSDSAPSSSSSS
jgi:hypothetical protein